MLSNLNGWSSTASHRAPLEALWAWESKLLALGPTTQASLHSKHGTFTSASIQKLWSRPYWTPTGGNQRLRVRPLPTSSIKALLLRFRASTLWRFKRRVHCPTDSLEISKSYATVATSRWTFIRMHTPIVGIHKSSSHS